MKTPSKPVRSSQKDIHPRLDRMLERHLSEPDRQPLHPPSAKAFDAALGLAGSCLDSRPLIFDSGCGTGLSTRQLAQKHPQALVWGVDRSQQRLLKTGHESFPHREGNIIWMRAELHSFWKQAAAHGLRLDQHYLLYPNPWPKPAHLTRRWHAHPAMPWLLKLGGHLEMRCNWAVYAQEFAHAFSRATGQSLKAEAFQPQTAISRFEEKYQASGHTLYRVRVALDEANDSGLQA